jgi:molybdate transport system substrate-binding protein
MDRTSFKRIGVALALALIGFCIVVPAAQAQGGGRGPQVKVADAKPGDVRLIVSNGLRAPLEKVRPQLEQAVGHPLIIEYNASLAAKATIESGQPFEVAIVTPEVLDGAIAKGKVVARTRYDAARVPVAIGERGEAPKQDISSPAPLKKALLGAKGIRFAYMGASRPTLDKMIADLGVADAIKEKIIMDGPGAPGPNRQVELTPGEYELIINLASEVLPNKAQVYLGDIPKELQIPAIMAAGIGSNGDARTAKVVIAFLRGPAIEAGLAENGMHR